jgi:hypothetical protein
MFSHIKNIQDLIGKKIECSIGEPWDFESEAGQNKIKGEIIDISTEEDKKLGIKNWVLCKIIPFSLEGKKITFFYASKRYTEDDLIKDLMNGKSVTCNFPYDKSGKELTGNRIRKAELEKNPENFGWLIGSIKITNYTESR